MKRDQIFVIFQILLTIAINSVYACYVLPYYWHSGSTKVIIFLWGFLMLTTILLVVITNIVDPGYVPQNTAPDPTQENINETTSLISINDNNYVNSETGTPYNNLDPSRRSNLSTQISPSETIRPSDTFSQIPPSKTEHNTPAAESIPKTYPFLGMPQQPSAPGFSYMLYTRNVVINGITLDTKYCTTCKCWRPPRASHCSDCERCIEKHDHHCPWMGIIKFILGNCVGRYNYSFFFLYLIFVNLNILLVGISTAVFTYLATKDKILYVPVFLIIFVSALALSLMSLCLYHCFLASKNVTTHEEVITY